VYEKKESIKTTDYRTTSISKRNLIQIINNYYVISIICGILQVRCIISWHRLKQIIRFNIFVKETSGLNKGLHNFNEFSSEQTPLDGFCIYSIHHLRESSPH